MCYKVVLVILILMIRGCAACGLQVPGHLSTLFLMAIVITELSEDRTWYHVLLFFCWDQHLSAGNRGRLFQMLNALSPYSLTSPGRGHSRGMARMRTPKLDYFRADGNLSIGRHLTNIE